MSAILVNSAASTLKTGAEIFGSSLTNEWAMKAYFQNTKIWAEAWQGEDFRDSRDWKTLAVKYADQGSKPAESWFQVKTTLTKVCDVLNHVPAITSGKFAEVAPDLGFSLIETAVSGINTFRGLSKIENTSGWGLFEFTEENKNWIDMLKFSTKLTLNSSIAASKVYRLVVKKDLKLDATGMVKLVRDIGIIALLGFCLINSIFKVYRVTNRDGGKVKQVEMEPGLTRALCHKMQPNKFKKDAPWYIKKLAFVDECIASDWSRRCMGMLVSVTSTLSFFMGELDKRAATAAPAA